MDVVLQNLRAQFENLHARTAAVEETVDAWRSQSGDVAKITAAVDGSYEASEREQRLEQLLARAEAMIATLQTQAAPAKEVARKTLPSATVQLLAKQGIDAEEGVEMGSLDAALKGLSIEQRIAVKAQMLRSGVAIS